MKWERSEIRRQADSLEYIAVESGKLSESQVRSLLFAVRMLNDYADTLSPPPPSGEGGK